MSFKLIDGLIDDLTMNKNTHFWQLLWLIFLITLLPNQKATTKPELTLSILTPTGGSVLSSPIYLQIEIEPDIAYGIKVCLVNDNNLVISRQLYFPQANPNTPTFFESQIPFEIPTETSEALLTVTLMDEFNRPQSLRAIPITLSSNSEREVFEAGVSSRNWLEIKSPSPGSEISGGVFNIEGTLIPQSTNPIIIELMTDSGRVLGNAFLTVETQEDPIDFILPITYVTVSEPQNVRLIIRQSSPSYQTTIILDSLILTLMP
jgi:hypothetical protein